MYDCHYYYTSYKSSCSINTRIIRSGLTRIQSTFYWDKQKKQRQKSNDKENLKGKNFENFLFYNIYIWIKLLSIITMMMMMASSHLCACECVKLIKTLGALDFVWLSIISIEKKIKWINWILATKKKIDCLNTTIIINQHLFTKIL